MTALELWVLAIGLAMDCFAVSVTGGLLMKQPKWPVIFKTAFLFGLFQALMPALGWLGGHSLSHPIRSVDHWVAFGLLAFLGIRMFRSGFKTPESASAGPDFSSNRVVFALAVATSLDALAVGVSLAFLGESSPAGILAPVGLIGGMAALLSFAGFTGGLFFNGLKKFNPELLGGLILFAIGLKIFIQHLVEGL
ncbi:manganese efflux pump MntP family protein [Oxalobacter paraformigenes]|uniref:Putative manganese efflux pump MntP n=1 Tax=Oxalobacter paraformigenes TaxID=556268 RepID=C3X312_9BURK|nr:manganese efflux pump MntP family protein [Oxalobacter paraformigenes]EEO27598.1 hypothetical protein OFAG_00751 [Oxalobacter paraformigenes]